VLYAVLAAVVFQLVLLLVPNKAGYEVNFDEGVNGIKALLMLNGHGLYSEVWSDQPPLFTAVLTGWIWLVGTELESLRLVSAGFGTLLLVSLFHLLRLSHGAVTGALGVCFLLFSGRFLRYCGALMVGMPSIAFEMLALALLVHAIVRDQRMLFYCSSVAAAAGVLTKLLAGSVLFAIVVAIGGAYWPKVRPIIRDLLLYGLGGLLSLAVLTLIVSPSAFTDGYSQLIAPHLEAREATPSGGYRQLIDWMKIDFDFFFLACIGVALSFYRRKDEVLLPLTWFLTSFFLLCSHSPLWVHQYLYFSVPLIWLAAIGAGEVLTLMTNASARQMLKERWSGMLLGLSALVVLVVTLSAIPAKHNRIQYALGKGGYQLDVNLVKAMELYQEKTRWVLTDRPVYALQIERPVPPKIAVSTWKRKQADLFDASDYIDALEQYQPEQVLLQRFKTLKRKLPEILAKEYDEVYRNSNSYLYVRRALIHGSSPSSSEEE